MSPEPYRAVMKSGLKIQIKCHDTCQYTNYPVYGDMKYSKDSSICRSAYHAGVLTKPGQDKEGQKTRPKLSQGEFINLVLADPTTRLNNVDVESATPEELSKIKAGSYVPWIIKNYLILLYSSSLFWFISSSLNSCCFSRYEVFPLPQVLLSCQQPLALDV